MLRLFIQIVIPVVLVTFAIYALTRKRTRKRSKPNPVDDDDRAVEVRDAGPISVPAFLTIVAMGALFSLGLVAVLA